MSLPADQRHESDSFNEDQCQNVQTFRHKDLVIVLPEEFLPDSDTLVQNQKDAIDRNAVYKVKDVTKIDVMGWAFDNPPMPFVQVNLPPIARNMLDYSLGYPISLVERDGLVVAGVFLMSTSDCFKLHDDSRNIILKANYDSLLKRLHYRQLTYRLLRSNTNCTLSHHDEQNDLTTMNSVTASAPYSPTTLALTTQPKRRISTEVEEDTSTPQPKRWCNPGSTSSNIVTSSTPSMPSVTQPNRIVELNGYGTEPDQPEDDIHTNPTNTIHTPTPDSYERNIRSAYLAQSADKNKLFDHLKLDEKIHKMLLLDAKQARNRLSQDRSNLTIQLRADPSVQPPFKWDEISEKSKHQEMLNMANNAPSQTNSYYIKGRYKNNLNEENWVARWYLWHSFRYGDRTRKTGASPPPTGPPASSVPIPTNGAHLPQQTETSIEKPLTNLSGPSLSIGTYPNTLKDMPSICIEQISQEQYYSSVYHDTYVPARSLAVITHKPSFHQPGLNPHILNRN